MVHMSEEDLLNVPFYRAGLERLSFAEILGMFLDPEKKAEISAGSLICM